MNKYKIIVWIVAIIIIAYFILRVPSASFDGESSEFSFFEDLTKKELVLEKTGAGKIVWKNTVNVEYLNIDDSVKIRENNIAVDTERLNAPAQLYLYGLDYKFTPVVYRNNKLCPDEICSNARYDRGTLIFSVSGFTNYTSGANANMTIWDETDIEKRYANESVIFFANYTNSTNGEIINDTKANCTIAINNGTWLAPQNMAFNSSSKLWEYNRSFESNGTYIWNATCNGTNFGYEALLGSDTIAVNSNIPEVVLDFPQNGYNDNDGKIIFRCNATDDKGIKNVSLWINSSGWTINKTYYYSEKAYYNFSGIKYQTSTHNATFGYNSSIPPSSLYISNEKEFNDSYIGDYNGGNYSEIISDDNDYAGYGYGTGNVPLQHFTFIISESEASIDVINVTWSGYGCYGPGVGSCFGGYGVHLYIWNSTGWEEVGNHTSTEQIISKEYNDKKYINDTDKKLHLLVEGWQPGALGNTIFTDFVQVWVNGTAPAKNISAVFNLSGINNGDYKWNCHAFDNDTNEAWALSNYTFTVNDIAKIEISFSSPTPNNETIFVNYTYINATLSETSDWIRLEWNGANETLSGSEKNWYKSKTNLANGNYSFKVWANDSNGNMNFSETRWVYVNYTWLPSTDANITATEDVYGKDGAGPPSWDDRAFIKFNFSQIAAGAIITDAILYLNKTNNGFMFSGPVSVLAYNCSDQTWTESSAVATFDMGCNYANNFTAVNANGVYRWNLTAAFKNAFDSGKINFTVALNNSIYDTTAAVIDGATLQTGMDGMAQSYIVFGSRTAATASERPYLYVKWISSGDITKPTVNIQLPGNTTYNYNISLPLNYTIADANLDKCWYNLDSGNNVSISNCINVTFNTSEGWYRLYLFANDTSGNLNNTNVSFTIDMTAPQIAIQSPQNQTYNYKPALNYTVSGAQECWYSNSTHNNVSLSNCNNLSAIGAEEWNSIKIYANDTVGNIGNSSLIGYTIDIKPPFVTNATADNVEMGQSSFITVNVSDERGISTAKAELQYPDNHRTNYTMSPYSGTGYNLTFSNTTALGTYIVRFIVNDTLNNVNNSVSTSFTAGDYTSPSIFIASPQNTTYPDSNISLNYTISDNVAIDRCWYNLDNGINTTLNNCQNTTVTANPSSHNVIVYVNDSSGNKNLSQVYFTVTNKPVVGKILKINSTGQDTNQFYLNSNATFRVNITDPDGASEIDKVLITIDAMNFYGADVINSSMNQIASIPNGWTYEYNYTVSALGNYTIIVYANDSWSAFNENKTNIFVPPSIRLASPKNGSTVKTGTIIDIEIDGPGVDNVWYANESAANYTIGAPYDIDTSGWSEKENKKVDIWANDTSNNLDYRIYYFDFDDTKPVINISTPANKTYGTNVLDFNFTVVDINLDRCWYSLNSGANQSLASCANTTITVLEGYNNITLFANDSAGNLNYSTIFFIVDTSKPLIDILSPQQNAIYNTTAVNLTIDVVDSGSLQCNRTLDSATTVIGIIQSGVQNTTLMNVALGNHYVNVTCADGGGNSNTSETITFYVYDAINLTIDAPSSGQILHRGTTESLTSTITNSTAQAITTNVTWYTTSEIANQEDYSWAVSINQALGQSTIHVNSTKLYHWMGYDNVSIFFYGWSRVNITNYSSSGGNDKNVTIECKVDDMNTTEGVQNYPVSFYNDTTLIGTNFTDTNGYAEILWHTQSAEGQHNLTCTIADNSTLFYNATMNESAVPIALWNPEIWGATVAPSMASWNEQFNYSVFVRDKSGQRLYVTLLLSRNNATWTGQQTKICNNCNVSTQMVFNKNDFACADEGLWYFKFYVTNNLGGYNETTGIDFTVQKIIINSASVTITEGYGEKVGVRGDDYINLTATFFDSKSGRYLNNVAGSIWIKRRGQWIPYKCISNSNGNCTLRFNPDCSYSGGKMIFKAGIYNDPCVENVNSSESEFMIDSNADCFHDVTFSMEFNISGAADNLEPQGYYKNIKYACVDDETISGTPVLGIAFSGKDFRFVNTTNTSAGNKISISQLAEGNRFVIPITKGGCGIVSSKMSLLEKFMSQTFTGFSEMKYYPVEVILDYPGVDIEGEETMSGSFVINLRKEGNKIIIRRK